MPSTVLREQITRSPIVRYIQNEAEIASEKFEDGIVVINFLTGRYFTLNPTAERIWQGLASPSDSASLALLFEAGGDLETVRAQIDDFLDKLREQRLIASTEADGPVSQADKKPVGGYETPILNVFEDLSELILLDPIHEVNENLGWPVAPDTTSNGKTG